MNAKKCHIFSYNLPTGTLSSVLTIFIAKILQALFRSAQHLYEKKEGPGAVSVSVPLTNGSESGRQKKTCES